MKRIAIILMAAMIFVTGCSTAQPKALTEGTRTVVDMAGREVEIPQEVETVFATGLMGTIILNTLAPEMISGLNSAMSETEIKYFSDANKDLPVLGGWRGPSYSGNIEEFLMVSPDVIINMGDVLEAYISDAQEIESQTGIPVLMVDGSIQNTDKAYAFLGQVLGREERAGELADYFREKMDEVMAFTDKLDEEEKVRVYYAIGPKGLETELSGSINSEIIEVAGGVNIASSNWDPSGRRINVSLEQVILENPDAIIISLDGDSSHQVYNEIMSSPGWKDIKAVQEGRVYEIPDVPYDWINRPPSVNRVIGIQWMASILYPELYHVDINQEIKDFFKLYYSYQMTDEEIEDILSHSR